MTESEAIPLKLVCPECGFTGKVVDMRSHKGMYIRRRRECENGHRWTTYEYNANDIKFYLNKNTKNKEDQGE